MPNLLSDPPRIVLLTVAAFVIVAGAVWFARQERKSLAVLLVAVGLAAVVFLLDSLFESPREEAVRRVHAMVRAADAQDPAAFTEHLADTFEYRGETGSPVVITREQIRTANFWNVLKQHKAHVAAWDFAREDVVEVNDRTLEIGFLAKGEGGGRQVPVYFRATFTRQPDGQMKLTALSTFDPMGRENKRVSIPFFP